MTGHGIATIASGGSVTTGGKPTSNRAELRRSICMELGMPFYQRYGTYLTASSGSVGSLVDTDLTQEDDFWNNGWLFIGSDTNVSNNGAVRLIDDFNSADDKLLLEYNLGGAPSTGTQYEILSIFSPREVHATIDRSIADGFPSFYDIITDETMVVEEDQLEYDISALTYSPWIVNDVFVEQASETVNGIADSAGATSLVDADASTDIASGWLLSLYDGTGSGQLRTVTSHTGSTIGVATWSTNPDSTSKYRAWNPNEQSDHWYRMMDIRFDRDEHPSKMYLNKRLTGSYGMRFRLIYATAQNSLSADTDVTCVPKEFIINRAIEMLAASRVSSSRVDREKWATCEQLYRQKADVYKERNSFRMTTNMSIEEDPNSPSGIPDSNPMGWK